MGRAHALILVLVTALSCAPGVRADLPATTRGGVLGLEDASQARAVDNVDDSTLAALCSCTAQNGLIWRQPESGWLDEFFTGETAGGAFDLPVRGAPNRCEVPALPGSARLFLTAMLSLGAWHLARSVRQFDFGVFPEWYHSGGPLQVGHAVAFDLDFHALPSCFIAASAEQVEAGSLWFRVGREPRTPCTQRSYLRARIPRAPPQPS